MQRTSVIATVVAAGSILVAGSVASVAVINAASSAQPEPHAMALAEPQPDQAQDTAFVTDTAQETSAPVATDVPAPLPSLSEEPLPELPTVEQGPIVITRQAPAAPVQKQTVTKKQVVKKKVAKKPSAKPSPSASATQSESQAPEISLEKAVEVVLNATDGGVVKNADKENHGGYDAWAIRVLRHDGSIITGYVDLSSGVVFDWVVNQEAPAPAAPQTNSGSSSGSSSHEHEHESEHDDD
ncbi:MAG: hypothetical protein GC156_10590 [Actinomycetales bacterium]|nr:hypothetical protein [Actinomycetales bacterium]